MAFPVWKELAKHPKQILLCLGIVLVEAHTNSVNSYFICVHRKRLYCTGLFFTFTAAIINKGTNSAKLNVDWVIQALLFWNAENYNFVWLQRFLYLISQHLPHNCISGAIQTMHLYWFDIHMGALKTFFLFKREKGNVWAVSKGAFRSGTIWPLIWDYLYGVLTLRE